MLLRYEGKDPNRHRLLLKARAQLSVLALALGSDGVVGEQGSTADVPVVRNCCASVCSDRRVDTPVLVSGRLERRFGSLKFADKAVPLLRRVRL